MIRISEEQARRAIQIADSAERMAEILIRMNGVKQAKQDNDPLQQIINQARQTKADIQPHLQGGNV